MMHFLLAVAVVAVNIAGFRFLADSTAPDSWIAFRITAALPMASILAMGAVMALTDHVRRGHVGSFLLAFEIVGAMATTLVLASEQGGRGWVDAYLGTMMDRLQPVIETVGIKPGNPQGASPGASG